jgi:hypothetical protein
MNTMQEFLRWEERSRDVIDVKRCYIRIAGDLASGVLLSQIVYWFLPSKRTGNPRVTIDREGRNWLAKKRDEWWDECCISPKQFDRSIEVLESRGIVTTAVFKFQGSPTKHISLNFEPLIQLIGRGENESSPKVNNEIPETATSKSTVQEKPLLTESTSENTQRPQKARAGEKTVTDLCQLVGIFDSFEMQAMMSALTTHMRISGKNLNDAVEHMVGRWLQYQEGMKKREWSYGSAYKFFTSGLWDKPDLWPTKKPDKDDPMARMKFSN